MFGSLGLSGSTVPAPVSLVILSTGDDRCGSGCRKSDYDLVSLLLFNHSRQRQRLLAERLCDLRERLTDR